MNQDHIWEASHNKKRPHPCGYGLSINKSWRCPTLTWGDPTLPSALSVFTSEFEKGSGGSHSLLPPENLVWEQKVPVTFFKGNGPLTPVGEKGNWYL